MNVAGVSNSFVNKEDFLRLFVAQLQNQSPMDPMEGHEFMAQLAQFSTVEQLTNLNASFSEVFKFQQLVGGGDLVGKTVSYLSPETGEILEGTISSAEISDGTIYAIIQNERVPIANIREIFS